jgi:glycosyltransferase involved in cell wall biosynthesis
MGRVLIVAHATFPGTSRLFNQASVLLEAGHEVAVVCCPGGEARRIERRGRLLVVRVGLSKRRGSPLAYAVEWPVFLLLASAAALALAIARPFDLTQIFNQPDFLVLCGLPARLRGALLLLDHRDPMPETYMSKFGAGPRHPAVLALRLVEAASLRIADRVLTVSEEYRRRLASKGVPEDRIGVFMNCPDESLFSFEPRAERAPGTFTVVYHGTLARRLGPDVAVRAAALARREVPGLRLLIAGEGEMGAELTRLVREERAEGFVQLRGQLPPEAIPALLREADLAVAPMRRDVYTETVLPTKLLESVAAGVPIAASDTRAVRAAFGGGEVRLVAPGDPADLARAIADLARDAEGRRRLALRARERYAKLVDRPAMVRAYLDLVSGPDRARPPAAARLQEGR